MNLKFWTGPIPYQSMRHQVLLDYFIHPIKRHLARIYLNLLKNLGCTVIGITGSYGKTSTKDALYSILSKASSTTKTTANIDPVYNIPATILSTPLWTRYLILEMGIEFIGEMDFYMWLAPVDIAVITGIGLTHTEHLIDIKTVKSEKFKITRFARKIFDYSNKKPRFENNLEIASEVAKYLKVSQKDINQGLETFTPPPHRMQQFTHPTGAMIIDDSYNANPTATAVALKTLVKFAQQENKIPVFVFGQMNELGTYEKSAHENVGRLIKTLGIKDVLTIGPATKYTISSAGVGKIYPNHDSLLANLKPFLNRKYIILCKGSRSWKLEKLVDKINGLKSPDLPQSIT